MLWIGIIAITFATVSVAELGDKSQLITISLASKYSNRKKVFLGLVAGTATVTIISVTIGSLVFQFIPMTIVKMLASLIFIIFGILILTQKNKENDKSDSKYKGAFSSSFILSIIAEFGDKTQLTIIALTARYSSPILVFFGAILGLSVITAVGVVLGTKLSKLFNSQKIELITGMVFLAIGIIFFFEAILF